jgi:hypothetical protein
MNTLHKKTKKKLPTGMDEIPILPPGQNLQVTTRARRFISYLPSLRQDKKNAQKLDFLGD